MNLRVGVDGRWMELELERDGERCSFRLRRDGAEDSDQTASLVEVEPGVYSMLWNGRSYEVRVEPANERMVLAVGGRLFDVEVADPRRQSRRSRGWIGEGRISVSAPMPGKVVRVLVSDGEAVEAGQGLVVVEAMKMQNEMKAPKSGKVSGLRVREGAAVAAGEVLVTIE
jgi:biotin carboxyl carrier protein